MKCGFLKDSTVKRLLGEGGDVRATEFELQQRVQSSPYVTKLLSWTVIRELTMLVVVMEYCEGGDVKNRIPPTASTMLTSCGSGCAMPRAPSKRATRTASCT